MPPRSAHTWAVTGILLLSAVWGASFAAMKALLSAGLSVGSMLAVRFTLGALGLGLGMLILRVRVTRQALKDGLWLGLVLTPTFWLQADGLRYTTTSKSGFITGLYVIFTPLVGLLFRQLPKRSHAIGAVVATLGLFLLVHEPGRSMGGWNFGDTETLLCAVLCGFHIVMTGRFSQRSSGWALALGQVTVVALLSWGLALVVPPQARPDGSKLGGFEGLTTVLRSPGVWLGLFYLSMIATALAFYLMSTLQKHLGATEAAIAFSMEPVFAAALAMSGLVPGVHEHLAPLQLLGGVVIVSAMLLAELGPRLLREETV